MQRPNKTDSCLECGKLLSHTPGRRKKKYCSQACKTKHWISEHKGQKQPKWVQYQTYLDVLEENKKLKGNAKKTIPEKEQEQEQISKSALSERHQRQKLDAPICEGSVSETSSNQSKSLKNEEKIIPKKEAKKEEACSLGVVHGNSTSERLGQNQVETASSKNSNGQNERVEISSDNVDKPSIRPDAPSAASLIANEKKRLWDSVPGNLNHIQRIGWVSSKLDEFKRQNNIPLT